MQHGHRMPLDEMSPVSRHAISASQVEEGFFVALAQLTVEVRERQAPAAHIAQEQRRSVAGIHQVQLGLTLDSQAGRLLDDPLIELVVLYQGIGNINRCHDFARQRMITFARQVHRYREMA
ncbi:hypothetical protein D3C80_1835870 [compost metagenome]